MLRGRFVPLFDPELPVVSEFAVEPGRRALLLDLAALPAGREGVVAAACRVRDEAVTATEIRFRADGTEGSRAVVRVAMPKAPASVTVGGKALGPESFDFSDGSLRLRFANVADGVSVVIAR